MNRSAMFCDGTGNFVYPPEPDLGQKILLKIRTAANDAKQVFLLVEDAEYPMEKKAGAVFDYYEIEWQLGEELFRYRFRIEGDDETVYYTQYGASEEDRPDYHFEIMPGFSTPEWAKGAVMYQIYVDRFYNGDPTNDVESGEYLYIGELCVKVEDWEKYPAAMGVREFYGGDLQGVLEKLDYLQDLGVEVIYFNPLFVSPSNHKYDIQDYDYIDPHFGKIVTDGGECLTEESKDNRGATKYKKRVTDLRNLEASNELFAFLVEEMHKRGMKVILDGVFNHCGSFNKWMDREQIYEGQEGYEDGAYVSSKSPYKDFFQFTDTEKKNWPYNGKYDGWWGHDTLPKLNYEQSEKLEEYILNIGKKWVMPPYNIDGWRLDVAADLGHSPEYNHAFWKKFRKVVKEANPNALILAEHYGDTKSWLMGDEWDSVMNYDAFMEPVTWFLTGMEKHSDSSKPEMCGHALHFLRAMAHHTSRMLTPSRQVAMNELSNHDHSRFLTRTNKIVGRTGSVGPEAAEKDVNTAIMREAVVMQMTWVGAPTLYYGDEAGLCGFTDPDNRRTYPWGKEDKELLAFHKEIIRIHKEHKMLRTGSLKMLHWDDQVLAYGRFSQEDQMVVIINNGEQLREVNVPVWLAGVPKEGCMRRLLYTYEKGYTLEHEEYQVREGQLVVNMGSHSALVLKRLWAE